MTAADLISSLRSRLILDRAAVLLTVESNCLAGWWLGGGGRSEELPLLFVGAALLYLGGAFWSDAFTEGLGRKDHPLPADSSGGSALTGMQTCGLALLGVGVACLFWLGNAAGGLGLALMVLAIVAQVLRGVVSFSIVVPAISRLILYLIGACAGVLGVAGATVWSGVALAIYVLGAGYVARQQNIPGPERHWPIILLVAPIGLALIVDDDGVRRAGLLLSAVLALWTVRCLRPALWSEERDFARAFIGLAAGIVLVDLLATADAPKLISGVFIALFLAARGLQNLARDR